MPRSVPLLIPFSCLTVCLKVILGFICRRHPSALRQCNTNTRHLITEKQTEVRSWLWLIMFTLEHIGATDSCSAVTSHYFLACDKRHNGRMAANFVRWLLLGQKKKAFQVDEVEVSTRKLQKERFAFGFYIAVSLPSVWEQAIRVWCVVPAWLHLWKTNLPVHFFHSCLPKWPLIFLSITLSKVSKCEKGPQNKFAWTAEPVEMSQSPSVTPTQSTKLQMLIQYDCKASLNPT